MASEAAIAAPIASPISSLKYGRYHFSGDSITPSGLSVDVVVDDVAVLEHKAEDGDHVLGYVPNGDQQSAPRAVGAPGVVPLHVGFFGRDVEPTLRELAYAAAMSFQDGL